MLRAADMPLSIVSEPVNNDTERLMGSVGNWVTTHQPVLMLSFLDRARNFYAQLVARAAGVPIVSMTRTYQDQFDSQLYSRRGGVKVSALVLLVCYHNSERERESEFVSVSIPRAHVPTLVWCGPS